MKFLDNFSRNTNFHLGECYGGIARLKSAVDNYTQYNKNVVFVNGGDFYQGNIWYTIFKWKVVAQFAQYLKFDAMVNNKFLKNSINHFTTHKNKKTQSYFKNELTILVTW